MGYIYTSRGFTTGSSEPLITSTLYVDFPISNHPLKDISVIRRINRFLPTIDSLAKKKEAVTEDGAYNARNTYHADRSANETTFHPCRHYDSVTTPEDFENLVFPLLTIDEKSLCFALEVFLSEQIAYVI
jgi:hypothetical protein